MATNKVFLIEERCDRCNAMMAVKNSDGEEVMRRVDSKGSIKIELLGKTVVYYENVCPACYSTCQRIIEKMGKIDRTRGGKKPSVVKSKRGAKK